MDATQRKHIGMLYRIDGRRLTRSTTRSVDMISSPPPIEWAREHPTDREIAVLQLVADGFANREIGQRLSISEVKTVKSHVRNLLAKLNARNRAHAVSIASRNGLIT